MKKYILSTLVMSTFIVYIIYQQVTGTNDIIVKNPINNSAVSSSNSFSSANNQNTSTNNVPSVPIVPVLPKQNPVVVQKGQYKNGTYTGVSADAYYGNIQVQATISGGKLTDVQFLDHPQDRGTSIRINDYAMPILRSEAIQAQSANVNTISGATDSSGAFKQSLQSALSLAKN